MKKLEIYFINFWVLSFDCFHLQEDSWHSGGLDVTLFIRIELI